MLFPSMMFDMLESCNHVRMCVVQSAKYCPASPQRDAAVPGSQTKTRSEQLCSGRRAHLKRNHQ